MENFIKNLKISNFKSIREAEMECGRINLFVGKPNVGKSNVLEAVSLLGFDQNKGNKYLTEFIRYEKLSNLFYFLNREEPIGVTADDWHLNISYEAESGNYDVYYKVPSVKEFDRPSELMEVEVDNFGNIINIEAGKFKYCRVRKYHFKEKSEISTENGGYLATPHGHNLFWVLQTTKKLKDEIPGLFSEYGLEFLVDLEENKFAVQRKESGIAYKIPYSLIADTLQRIIFHYAAIFSNKDSVILFEEPESHSFPPYVRELALKIVESTENQFFITTHSPHLFTTIVEETEPEDLAVFITYFEDYETKFKKLGTDEINDILNYGVDIFFNQKWFLNEKGAENPA